MSAAPPPPVKRRRRLSTAPVVLLWALIMTPLLTWGLPSSRHDDLLFGGEPAWKAEHYHIAALLQRLRERDAGADTDLDPITGRDRLVDLTVDDQARAEILLAYRLYSRQPDEMLTFRALMRMRPWPPDFDPRMYQYGGGYIYLVGAALGASAVSGLVHLTRDAGFYLEHPEQFARFYIVARCVSLVFGVLTLVAVHKLARRAAGRTAGWFALLAAACCPVFITAVLEAKPHLPSACMVLWATLSALDYQARGRMRDALRMGLQAGYAFGLVLTGCLAALLWPALFLARSAAGRRAALRPLLVAGGAALAVYALTNPYLPYDLVTGRAAVASNIANSTAMYQGQMRQALSGAVRVAELLLESAGLGVLLAGSLGLALLLRRHPRAAVIGSLPGLGMLVLGAALGAGKPAECARFLILPVLLLCVAAATLFAMLARRRPLLALLALIVVLGVMRTPVYVRSFAEDVRGDREARAQAGVFLKDHLGPADAVGVLQEPAPYAVPPLDFAHRRIVLLPARRPRDLDEGALPTWLVFTADDDGTHAGGWWHAHYKLAARFPPACASLSRISWANKLTFIYGPRPRDTAAP